MMMAIRAALIPSSPRRAMVITAMFVAPMMLVTLALEPVVDGVMAWRAPGSGVSVVEVLSQHRSQKPECAHHCDIDGIHR